MAKRKNTIVVNHTLTLVQSDVDHGKTTLTAAITTVLARRLPSAVNFCKDYASIDAAQKNVNAVCDSLFARDAKLKNISPYQAPGRGLR